MKTIIAVIFLCFTIVIGFSMIEREFGPVTSTNSGVLSEDEKSSSSEIEEEIKVILTGEIVNPGTYTIKKGEYLETALQFAGGITSNADSSCFDYFLTIEEDITLYIACKTEDDKVSINDAPLEQIITLEGIGPSLANAIIDHRNTYGSFLYLEQLMDVKGIGKQTFEKNKNKICL